MATVSEINQIYCKDSITVKQINMTALLFVDNKVVSKSRYSVIDNFINLLDQAENTISLYQHRESAYYYEYSINLSQGNTLIFGKDINGNTLTLLNRPNSKNYMMVFVDGYKLLPSQFNVDIEANYIEILNPFPGQEKYTVIIYISPELFYRGDVTANETWQEDSHSFVLEDYSYTRYIFFKNGKLISRDLISKVRDVITINVEIRKNIDIIEYYSLPVNTENVLFYAEPGYFSYGPRDSLNLLVPEIHDAEVTFQSIVRLAIDDVRPGFFIKETTGDGCLMITGKDFETKVAYCTTIVPFSKTNYTNTEYFVQVPRARSILKYLSEYDLQGIFLPELLGSFQRLLLDETYDSIQRLKNTRSINYVDSSQIGQLINFMGLNLNITNLDLEKKHAILEELTNFYKIVGTRESYNFYNLTASKGQILKMEQLFTPIRDINTSGDYTKRYVDFRTAEELGAETHTRYEYPHHDLGYVDELAQPTDSFTNQPRSEGEKTNPNIPAIVSNKKPVIYIFGKVQKINDNPETYSNDIYNDQNKKVGIINGNNILDLHGNVLGTLNNEIKTTTYKIIFIKKNLNVPLNSYTILPSAGPNQPTIDFGYVYTTPVDNIYDFGLVSDSIKGKWIEWITWNRPKNWYPTNHVAIDIQIPSNISYETFMTEFKNNFYDIASTVLYIHNIIGIYVFGRDDPLNISPEEAAGGGSNFDIPITPVYYTLEYAFTNDSARQDYRQ